MGVAFFGVVRVYLKKSNRDSEVYSISDCAYMSMPDFGSFTCDDRRCLLIGYSNRNSNTFVTV
jgi:hypothetical protein